jgi:hypothetical protein
MVGTWKLSRGVLDGGNGVGAGGGTAAAAVAMVG